MINCKISKVKRKPYNKEMPKANDILEVFILISLVP